MRIPYTDNPPKYEKEEDQTFIDKLVQSRGNYGLSHLDLAVLHSPAYARGFMNFFGAVRFNTTVPDDAHELAMSRVGALNGSAFEWMHHAPLLLKAGLSKEAVETVRTIPSGHKGADGEGGLDARLWAIQNYIDEMTTNVKVSDETFEGLRKYFSNQQIVELTLTIAGYNAISRFLVALDVAEMKDLVAGDAELPGPSVPKSKV